MVTMQITYEGGLRCNATHGPSGSTLTTDAPVDNHGKGEAFSPTDLCASALGTCMATIMGIFAERHEIDLTGMTVQVTKEMSLDLPRRISRLGVTFRIPHPEDHPHRKALENAALTCPVHHSLHPEVEKPVVFEWIG